MGCRRALVPEGLVFPFKVIVSLRGVAGVVTSLAEVGYVGCQVCGDGVAAPHVLGAEGRGIDSHKEGGTCDSAYGRVRISVGEARAPLS